MGKKRKNISKYPAATPSPDRQIDEGENNVFNKMVAFLHLPSNSHQQLEMATCLVLLALGIFQAIVYFDHKVVPNSDFPAFLQTGQSLWALELPHDFKRAPVLGVLQVGLSHLVGGQTPGLTAGRLLNAIVHPLTVLLFWLVGKRIVGAAAAWIAVLAAINPWVVFLIPEPIAETLMLFFVLAGFYFTFKHSRWAYLFAALASMTRYDAAALILALMVFDLICRKNLKERLMTLVWTAAAALPLLVWMLLTLLHWETRGEMHYLNVLTGTKNGFWHAFLGELKLLWEVAFQPLIYFPQEASLAGKMIMVGSQFAVALGVLFALVWGLARRNWKIMALLVFLLPFFLVHVFHAFNYHRFYTAIHWIVLLICAYGGYNGWKFLKQKSHLPKWSIGSLQALILIAAFIALVRLIGELPKIAPFSVNSTALPYVCLSALGLIYFVRLTYLKTSFALRDLAATLLVAVMIISNQFTLVRVVGNGQRDIEFKLLADWYHQRALPGEKLVTTMPHVVRLFSPKNSRAFIHTRHIGGNDFRQFTQACYQKNISYVAWDSRLGFYPHDRYYQLYKLNNVAPLYRPKSIGPYEYLETIGQRPRFINIFRLRSPAQTGQKK